MKVTQSENDKGISVSDRIDDKDKNRRKLLLGLGAGGAIAAWHKPVINAVVTPAHAQTSVPVPMPTPAELCPMITIGNVVTGPVSGTNVPPVCSVTFDVLSGTPGVSLTITAIDAGTLPADTTFSVDSLGTATDLVGPRIVWRGPAVGAPFCQPFTVIDDVTFSVTASCAASGGDTFTQDFVLSDLV